MLVNILWFLSAFGSLTCVLKKLKNPHKNFDTTASISSPENLSMFPSSVMTKALFLQNMMDFAWYLGTCWVYNKIWTLFYETLTSNFNVHFLRDEDYELI